MIVREIKKNCYKEKMSFISFLSIMCIQDLKEKYVLHYMERVSL